MQHAAHAVENPRRLERRGHTMTEAQVRAVLRAFEAVGEVEQWIGCKQLAPTKVVSELRPAVGGRATRMGRHSPLARTSPPCPLTLAGNAPSATGASSTPCAWAEARQSSPPLSALARSWC